MGDTDQGAVPGQQAGQPAPASGDGSQPPAGTEAPKFVTLEEAQRIADEAAAKAADQSYRRAQSLVDTNASRITKQVQEGFGALKQASETLKAVGHEIPADTLARAHTQVMTGAFDTPATPGGAPPASPATPPGQGETAKDPITLLAERMQSKAGITLEDSDPEMSNAKLRSEDPEIFLQGVDEGIAAKKARLAASTTPTPPPPGTPPTPPGGAPPAPPAPTETEAQRLARLASLGGGGGSPGSGLDGYSTEQLLEQAFPRG
jgi:hypothetical protein